MFRAQQNMFDDVIAKATDENLTAENWEYMMDAWEKINESGDNGPKDAVAALIKRLAHRNANVQLYTLELANALSQNCGPKMHRELASRSFTDALLRLAADRNTHPMVKSKILERMLEWTEMFSNEPDLGIMEQAYSKLKSQNPNLQPPSKPTKSEITDIDRQKEEEELQMALAISLKERASGSSSQVPKSAPPQNQQPSASVSSVVAAPASSQAHAVEPSAVPHTTAATVSRVRALFDFVPSEAGELAFRKGDIIAVLESVYKDWWKGSLRGQMGIFPLNYVEKLSDPTPEELRKEAQMEAEVFAEIKNVEKLLALLSTAGAEANVQDNEEITTLYHQTLAIRPKLIELIGKYSQKKDDFMSLNEKFIKARRDYESLLETSMSQNPAPNPHYPRQHPAPYAYPDATYPPQESQPGRYYTPAPHHHPSSPPLTHAAFSSPPGKTPYPVRNPSGSYYPDSDNMPAAPFYPVGQGPPGTQLPGGKKVGLSPSMGTGDFRQPSENQPQELATNSYDSPLTPLEKAKRRNSSMALNGPGNIPGGDRPVSPAAAAQGPQGVPQGGQYYTPYQGPVGPQGPPGQQPYQRPVSNGPNQTGPGPYSVPQAQPHGQGSQGYESPPPGQQQQGGYQAYSRPPPQQQQTGGYDGGSGGGRPQDYYGELFLPPGVRGGST
ncbi:ESCRT-0 subunit protein hse1 [Rhizina undulata]